MILFHSLVKAEGRISCGSLETGRAGLRACFHSLVKAEETKHKTSRI